MSDIKYEIWLSESSIRYQVSYQVADTEYQISSIIYWVSDIKYHKYNFSSIMSQASSQKLDI